MRLLASAPMSARDAFMHCNSVACKARKLTRASTRTAIAREVNSLPQCLCAWPATPASQRDRTLAVCCAAVGRRTRVAGESLRSRQQAKRSDARCAAATRPFLQSCWAQRPKAERAAKTGRATGSVGAGPRRSPSSAAAMLPVVTLMFIQWRNVRSLAAAAHAAGQCYCCLWCARCRASPRGAAEQAPEQATLGNRSGRPPAAAAAACLPPLRTTQCLITPYGAPSSVPAPAHRRRPSPLCA